METSEIQKALAAPFAETHQKNGLDYVTGEQVASRLNDCLGWDGWAYRIVEHGAHEDECWVLGELTTYNDAGHLVKQQFGSQKLNRGTEYGDGLKGAATDALKKCASLIGVGLYLHEKDGGQAAPQQAAPTPIQPKEKPRTLFEVCAQMGYSREQVIETTKTMFGKTPNQLGKEQADRLVLHLTEKAKEPASA